MSTLQIIAWISIATGIVSAAIIVLQFLRGAHQHHKIMYLVWPLTALYSGPIALWAFHREMAWMHTHERKDASRKPLWRTSALGATHCGAGCTLGDIIIERLVIAVPVVLLGRRIFGTWALDYAGAFMLGIAFQYFTIKPMRHLSVGKGLLQALKADVASLTAWQVGMYGWMAIVTFVIFGRELPKDGPTFWFMMQIAMIAGFLVSWPVNAWLIRRGVKEAM